MKLNNIHLKTKEEITTMTEGGRRLGKIKEKLKEMIAVGVSAWDVEKRAVDLISKSGGRASFMMVPDYEWATCVNVNEGVVHGIPKKETVFRDKDVVSVDVGLYYNNFHTDTSFTVGLNVDHKIENFLKSGEKALWEALKVATIGARIFDISKKMQTVEKQGYSVVRNLVGHGIGKQLHEQPNIPCFVSGSRSDSPILEEGLVIAVEIMYSLGLPEIVVDGDDNWTIYMADGKISALFEETLAVTKNGPIVITSIGDY